MPSARLQAGLSRSLRHKGIAQIYRRLHPRVLAYNKSGILGVKSHFLSMRSKHYLKTTQAPSTEAAERKGLTSPALTSTILALSLTLNVLGGLGKCCLKVLCC